MFEQYIVYIISQHGWLLGQWHNPIYLILRLGQNIKRNTNKAFKLSTEVQLNTHLCDLTLGHLFLKFK